MRRKQELYAFRGEAVSVGSKPQKKENGGREDFSDQTKVLIVRKMKQWGIESHHAQIENVNLRRLLFNVFLLMLLFGLITIAFVNFVQHPFFMSQS